MVVISACLAACSDDGGGDPGQDAGLSADAASAADATSAPDATPAPASCRNGIQDSDETDIDCGGSCGATCPAWARCDWHDDCGSGGICAEPNPRGAARGRTCRPRVADCAGNACGSELCFSMSTNLTSDPATTVVSYCEPRAQLHAACVAFGDKDLHGCVDGAACIDLPSDSLGPICVPANTPAGALCTADTCVAGYFCDHGQLGAATCRPLRSEGASCLNAADCGPGLHCDAFRNKCEPRAPLGGSCFASQFECVPGAHCQLAAGLRCENWVSCGSQMDCCATATGSECRAFDGHTHCLPPSGTCAAGAF